MTELRRKEYYNRPVPDAFLSERAETVRIQTTIFYLTEILLRDLSTHNTAIGFPPVPSRSRSSSITSGHISYTFSITPNLQTTSQPPYQASTTNMCRIIITYSCGCKPYTATKPCADPKCDKVERVREPPCALCVKEELEREQEKAHRK
ncbi:hypothetical protein GGR55DRAFT_468910 [Xylaria sp. FL0064]|nr:hypothetical protein GGR55DRAFT_468910 [Xylaria sp. FL0064]